MGFFGLCRVSAFLNSDAPNDDGASNGWFMAAKLTIGDTLYCCARLIISCCVETFLVVGPLFTVYCVLRNRDA
jgi:hypothetical protein